MKAHCCNTDSGCNEPDCDSESRDDCWCECERCSASKEEAEATAPGESRIGMIGGHLYERVK